MAEPLLRMRVGIVVERRNAVTAWAEHVWRPVAVLVGEPEAAPWTELSRSSDAVMFYAGSADIGLFRTETAQYRDNLASEQPALWVVLRPTGYEPPFDLVLVTADPAEGEAATQAGTDLVETVAMPESIAAVVAQFVAEHHVEQEFFKRKRDKADPNALGIRPRVPRNGRR
jgi:hypothetical protein